MRRLYEWKLMNPSAGNNNSSTTISNTTASSNSSTKNFPSQVGNYNKILTAIRAEKFFNYNPDNINRLSDRILDVDFEYMGKREIGLSIVYRPDGPNYVVITYDADDNEISKDVCASFEEVLDVLVYEGIIKDKTLCESASELTEWKYMSPPTGNTIARTSSKSSSLNYPSQEDRYKKLLAQINMENRFSCSIKALTDNVLEFDLVLDPTRTITISICYKPYTTPPVWYVGINNMTPVSYEDWNDVLDVFEGPGLIKDTSSLKESVSSIAEEFEIYNNLWK
jgi:hypothetical protein